MGPRQHADSRLTRRAGRRTPRYQCLLQNDVNLTSPPLSATCANTVPAFTSHFPNAPFTIDDYLAPEDTTCPAPGVFAPNGVPKGSGLPGAARATSCTASTKSNARSDGSADDLHSQVDANGMPTSYPLYTATGTVKDAALTVLCTAPRPAGLACGDFAVNTIQPPYQPYAPGTAEARRLPPQKAATIGDRLSEKGIDDGVVRGDEQRVTRAP